MLYINLSVIVLSLQIRDIYYISLQLCTCYLYHLLLTGHLQVISARPDDCQLLDPVHPDYLDLHLPDLQYVRSPL